MMKYMLDTNICSYIMKKKPEVVFERFSKLNIGDVCISTVTLAELEYGVEKSSFPERNRVALLGFITPLEIMPFCNSAAFIYGKVRAELEKQGKVIGAYDLMIGAHAVSEELILVTNNIREFERIPGLKFENWIA